MKKMEIIIRPEKLENLKEALDKAGVNGMTVSTVMGCGHQRGIKHMYRGTELNINLLHKVKVETVVENSVVETLVQKVKESVGTGNVGDGKIFIYNVEDAVRIRTGESGEDVI